MPKPPSGIKGIDPRHPPNLRLRAEREERGWGLQQMANAIVASMKADGDSGASCDENTIYRWEAGIRRPSSKFQTHLIKIFDKSASELGFLPSGADGKISSAAERAGGGDPVDNDPRPLPVVRRFAQSHRRVFAGAASALTLVASLLVILSVLQLGPFGRGEPIVTGLSAGPSTGSTNGQGSTGSAAARCPKLLDGRVNRNNVMTVLADASSPAEHCWTQHVSPVAPATVLKYLVTYQNSSRLEEDQVYVKATIPPGTYFVPGSTRLFNQSNPKGTLLTSNNLTQGGVVIGNYNPLGGAYVEFSVALPESSDVACGWTNYRLVAAIGGHGVDSVHHVSVLDQYYNTAIVDMYRDC